MPENPYHRFRADQLILRDLLAVDRTALANERTLLAYLRTAFALLIAGVSFIKLEFFQSDISVVVLGWVCLPVGVVVAIVGIWRYVVMYRNIEVFRASPTFDRAGGNKEE
jgi:putative membrane protein